MDRRIRDYIHNNRERYTREAIRSKLIGAGHDPSAIDQALQEVWSEPGRLQPKGEAPLDRFTRLGDPRVMIRSTLHMGAADR